jgi:upstream activation factor subunit UAF30
LDLINEISTSCFYGERFWQIQNGEVYPNYRRQLASQLIIHAPTDTPSQAILSVADFEQVSVKRIRRALQELFDTEFENKKEINDLILSRYHKMEEEPRETKKKKIKKKAPKKEGESAKTSSISSMELNLSPKLAELLGVNRLPRTQVVKQIWEYIKQHDLQNPNDKREILCDEKLSEILGKKTTMFKMNKALSAHLYKDDE